jgi:hypothetical protein
MSRPELPIVGAPLYFTRDGEPVYQAVLECRHDGVGPLVTASTRAVRRWCTKCDRFRDVVELRGAMA